MASAAALLLFGSAALALLAACDPPLLPRPVVAAPYEHVKRSARDARAHALEDWARDLESRVAELERAELEMRRQLLGYIAAEIEPRADYKGRAAADARRLYDELVGHGMTPKAAAVQVLSTPPPR